MDLMNRVFHLYIDQFVIVFIDDILVYSRNAKEHVFSLPDCSANFERLLILCQVFEVRVSFNEVVSFGHVTTNGIFVNPKKVEAIVNWERPKNIIEIRTFLGLAGYYRQFMEYFS